MAEPTKTTRRDFLSGISAREAIADTLAGPAQPLPAPNSVGAQPGSHLLSVSREAMACLFEVVYDAATYRDATETAVAALDIVARLETQLTVYRQSSEIMEINRRAAAGPIVVEEGLFNLLQRAVALSEATGGAFDITAGKLSQIWGFHRRQGRMPSQAEVVEALTSVGWRHLQLDESARTARFLMPGLELNLGAIGKGYALDQAADHLDAGGVKDFLIHGGNSSVLARGIRIKDEGGKMKDEGTDRSSFIPQPSSCGWSVALRHPLKPDIRLAEFMLCDQALGTSGSGTQFFHYQGKRYGHILDPRTGWPADQVLSATVIAPTAEQADALSTALYVKGLEAARAFCKQRPEIGALLITNTHAASGIELHPLNLPDSRWRRFVY
jgi:FAD:protein FMN transferase